MAMIPTDFTDILEESLNERDKVLQEKTLPEINIAEAVPVSEDLQFGVESMDYGVKSVIGTVKDGIIGNQTNSLKTIDATIEWKKATVGDWAKSATWTQQELEKVARLGIQLASDKQNALYANACATIQYAGYLGHKDVKGQVGLLTETGIETIENKKSIEDMTAEEFVEFILSAYDKAWAKSDYRIQPTHIAIDAVDYMKAVQKFSNNAVIVGTDLLPISAMDRIMAALRKASGNNSFNVQFVRIPAGYAQSISAGKTRLAIYTYDSDYLEMRVKMPELLPVRARDLLTYECGYRSAFTGVMFKEPESVVYVDYVMSSTVKKEVTGVPDNLNLPSTNNHPS